MYFCGNEELLAAYLDRRLSKGERALFEKHLSSCPSCLSEMIRVRAELDESAADGEIRALPGRTARREQRVNVFSRIRRIISAPVAAAAAALVLSAGFLRIASSSGWDPGVRAARYSIVSSMSISTIGELRLSGPDYEPAESRVILRGTEPSRRVLLEESEGFLRTSIRKYPDDPDLKRLLGHLYLIRGYPGMARIFYMQILDIRANDPATLNDLAVAVYRKGDLSSSARFLEEAWQRGGGEKTAYNLAIVYNELGDSGRSAEFMELYLKLDRSSGWAGRIRTLLPDKEREI